MFIQNNGNSSNCLTTKAKLCVRESQAGKCISEAMNNLSSGAVLGVLERQSKGDEWMLGSIVPGCNTLPPRLLVFTKPTHYQELGGVGWCREGQLGTSIAAQKHNPQ